MNKTNFVDIILQKSNSQPDKIILKDRWKNWTWYDLLSSSFEYTELIRKNFHHQNVSAIPILVGRSGESVAAIIGTIMAGYNFAPISYNQPSIRIKNILNSILLPSITFETKCWENDWKYLLKTNLIRKNIYRKRSIININYSWTYYSSFYHKRNIIVSIKSYYDQSCT